MKRMYGKLVFCIAVLLLLTACKAESAPAGTAQEPETAVQTAAAEPETTEETAAAESETMEQTTDMGEPADEDETAQAEDLFRFAVKTEGGELVPARAAFLLSMDEVLETLGLTEENIDYSLGEGKPRIIDNVSVEGVSDKIQETFSFEGGMLVSVQYAFQIGPDEIERICRLLNEQAEASMPRELLRGENEILKQGATYWDDEAQDMVMLSFADMGDSGLKAVVLQLSVSRAKAAAAAGA